MGVIDLTLTIDGLCLFKLSFEILVEGMTLSPGVSQVPRVASYRHKEYSKEKMKTDSCLMGNVTPLVGLFLVRLRVFAQFQLPVAFFSGWISTYSVQPRHRATSPR